MRLSLKRMELDAEAVDYTKKLLFIKRLNIVEPSFSLSTSRAPGHILHWEKQSR